MDTDAVVATMIVALILGSITALLVWYLRSTSYRHDWECENCGTVFTIPPREALLLSSHHPRHPRMTCPHCRARVVAIAVPKRSA
ncbi:hypothetical protein ACLRGF_01855 [Mycetocola zhadangensis]|uniref:hypothetical protein n=1 Tax=Mycetocola zhadangensis TaxID=1164595 RepID=UPI003A4DBD7A